MKLRQWERVKNIFDAAIELPSDKREQYLASACSNDISLLIEVKRLIGKYEEAGSFLRSGEPTPVISYRETKSIFSPEQVVGNRFSIVRLLGRGGMGEVYEALDKALNERVALKTLLPQIAQDEFYLARFRREVQLARRITHPNVCRVHDWFQDHSSDASVMFYTMEFLDGETLARVLQSNQVLNGDEILEIARQMAYGLDAAHAVNIIHRDFKPGNVIILRDSGHLRTVITDFGLSKPFDASRTITESGQLLGTLAYMAPELIRGGQPTRHSDIYAFGLVLRELQSKSIRDNRQCSLWNRIIERCLETESEDRYASAGGAVQELTSRSAASRVVGAVRTILVKASLRWASILLLSGVFIMALFAFSLRLYLWTPRLPEGSSVLLPEIVNSTSDQQLEGVTDLMRNQLEQSAKFLLVDRSEMNERLKEMGISPSRALDPKTLRELAWRSRSAMVLFATLSRVGNGYALNVRAESVPARPDSEPRHWDQSFSAGDKNELFSTMQQASRWFRALVEHVSPSSFQGEPLPQDTTTSSWEALLLFSQAERLKGTGQAPEAIALLEQSIAKDPDFSLAYMRLGDLYNSLNEEKKGFEFWGRAFDALQRRRVTQKEEVRIRGLFAQDSGALKESEQDFRTYEILFPHDYLASFYLASTLERLNRPQEALAEVKEAELKKTDAYAPVALEARLNLVLGRWDEAENAIQHLRKMGRNGSADSKSVGLHMLRDDFSGVANDLGSMAQSTDTFYRSKSYSFRAAVLSEMGRRSEAIAILKDGIAFDASNGFAFNEADKWIALGYLYEKEGQRASSRVACLRAASRESGRLHLLQAGTILARAGFIGDAEHILVQLENDPALPKFEQAKHQLRGEILLAQNRAQDALEELQKASGFDAPANPKDYLARALLRAGQTDRGREIYRQIAESPAALWQALDYQPPGFWRDVELSYVQGSPETKIVATTRLQKLEHAKLN